MSNDLKVIYLRKCKLKLVICHENILKRRMCHDYQKVKINRFRRLEERGSTQPYQISKMNYSSGENHMRQYTKDNMPPSCHFTS